VIDYVERGTVIMGFMNRLLTISETAKVLGVSRTTIYRFINDGKLKSVRVGCRLRFRQQDIEDFVNAEV
jgi:excisionase family DNA binding protein